MSRVVIFGNTDFTQLAHWYLEHDSPHEVVAFTVNREYMTDTTFCGLPVIPFEDITETYPPDQFSLFIAVGYTRRNRIRAALYQQAKALGYPLISYIHSSTQNPANIPVGEHCFILENVVLQPFTSIGDNVFILNSTTLSHHSHIRDHCFITHNVAISGHVIIEPYCFLGANATIRDEITIGASCVIGAGAVILRDTEPDGVYKAKATDRDPYLSNHLKKI